jgi:hypothetical protein
MKTILSAFRAAALTPTRFRTRSCGGRCTDQPSFGSQVRHDAVTRGRLPAGMAQWSAGSVSACSDVADLVGWLSDSGALAAAVAGACVGSFST